MKRRQTSLSEAWLIAGPTSSKKPVVTAEDDDERPEMLDLSQASAATGGGATVDVGDSEPNVSVRGEVLLCTAACCANDSECFQPPTLVPLAKNGRNFVPSWYKAYPWLSVCTTRGKGFCLYCRYTENHGLLTFSKKGKPAFTTTGFNNWKKAAEKFTAHESCSTHKEALLKWYSIRKPSISQQISRKNAEIQAVRREGLLKQLSAMRFLLRQGIALRGHDDEEGNLFQLLKLWSASDISLKQWLREKKYMSPQVINELITMMGLKYSVPC